MDFAKYLHGLERPVVVEVVYLAGRYLTHGLTKGAFLRQLDSDVKTRHRDLSSGVVLEIMAAIETAEASSIASLPMVKRFGYASELDDLLWDEIERRTDDARVDAALTALRSGS